MQVERTIFMAAGFLDFNKSDINIIIYDYLNVLCGHISIID